MTELDIRANAAKRAYLLNKHKMHTTSDGKLDELAVWRKVVEAAENVTVRPWKKDYIEPLHSTGIHMQQLRRGKRIIDTIETNS